MQCIYFRQNDILLGDSIYKPYIPHPEILPHLRMLGLGCPKSYGKDMGVDLHIINSKGDGVAALDFIGRLRGDSHITYIPSLGPPFPFDHAVLGETYRTTIDDFCDELIREIGEW